MRTERISPTLELDRDVAIAMPDGVRLMANVFRGVPAAARPVIVSMTPYGKDLLPDRKTTWLMRLAGVRFGHLDCSRWTGFEAPDPVFWTAAGYTVVQADVRGMHHSEGHAGVLTPQDAADYAAVIDWAARQPWSTGAVGLCGVSYLCMSQWRVAALRPPSLRAIVAWEGVTDMLREFGFQDGIPETGFIGTWWRFRMQRGHNRRFALAEDFPRERDRRPLDDAWWASKRPDLGAIEVPALVCASWSDHGLHTRGSLRGYEGIRSPQKWLFTHGRRKWATFYSAEARAVQRQFLDHFLREVPNDWEQTPRVRLEVRRTRDDHFVRFESDWPPPAVRYLPLYLDAGQGRLDTAPAPTESVAQYRSRRNGAKGRAAFSYRFDRETELTGSMSLKLWVATSEGDDLDLFVVVRKMDLRGREVHFYGYNGFSRDGVAKGWLRVSHRELDPTLSRPGQPWHTHRLLEPVAPGQIVDVEIEVLASSTLFEAGSSLVVEIVGHDAARYPAFRHRNTVNRGIHSVHTGGSYDSHLLVPVMSEVSERETPRRASG